MRLLITVIEKPCFEVLIAYEVYEWLDVDVNELFEP